MKKYTTPMAELLYVACEDVLTVSDPVRDDLDWDELP